MGIICTNVACLGARYIRDKHKNVPHSTNFSALTRLDCAKHVFKGPNTNQNQTQGKNNKISQIEDQKLERPMPSPKLCFSFSVHHQISRIIIIKSCLFAILLLP